PSGSTSGQNLGAGIYLRSGRLQGPAIRAMYFQWRERMYALVNPSEPGTEAWREQLAALAGNDGTWRLWTPGEPVGAQSMIGEGQRLSAILWAEIERRSAECQRRQLVDEELRAEIQRRADLRADLEARASADERRLEGTAAVAWPLALVVGAAVWGASS
ncbi:MAG: hypothetical protein GY873_13520, partial [Bosea sp.]|uniref:hypothetical protein n=1 Tax=Bosea sp. (in: a-proteobacteria) TaxID=1871050 RepID=UPI0023A642C7|nr:hypothetical protein [Bosea sp. (in: a-proteobacteria)]